MRGVRRLAGVWVLALLGALVADAANAQARRSRLTDQQIRERVEHELSETDINVMNVEVSVKDGIVTLSGTVPSAWAKQELIEEARKVDDVQFVVSDLTVSAGEGDEIIGEEIAKNVRRYVFYTIYDDINVEIHNGVVTLTGRVTMPHKAEDIADLAARVRGVQEVKNQIRALPVSGFDDQLRASIARQIYRDPMFWNYAIQVNPPIHIVVENGRVTLTGVVNSEVERRRVDVIARGTFGVLGVDNQLRVEGRQTSTSPEP